MGCGDSSGSLWINNELLWDRPHYDLGEQGSTLGMPSDTELSIIGHYVPDLARFVGEAHMQPGWPGTSAHQADGAVHGPEHQF